MPDPTGRLVFCGSWMRTAGPCEDYPPPIYRAWETSKTCSRRLQQQYGQHCRVFEVMPVNGRGFTASHTTSRTHTPRSAGGSVSPNCKWKHYPTTIWRQKTLGDLSCWKLSSNWTPLDRQVVFLYLEGLSAREIEQVTGMSANSVGVRLSRLRRRLASMVMSKEVRK